MTRSETNSKSKREREASLFHKTQKRLRRLLSGAKARDLTDAYEELRQAYEKQTRFCRNIAHEFRTPLTLIIGPVKQLIERTDDEKTKAELNVVRRNADRLLELVNRLHDSVRYGVEGSAPENNCEPNEPATEAAGEHGGSTQADDAASAIGLEGISGSEKPLLLIVEDNYDVRNYIKNNLEHEYRIREAVDGEDGWSKSIEPADSPPDIVVSDVIMPRMDGFRLCARLKTDERTSHIPVILLTVKASCKEKIEGFETGADDYITKPFEVGELKARIRNLIAQRKIIHDHFRKHGLFEIEEKNITAIDKRFIQKAVATTKEHLSDAAFGVETLAEAMAVSRSLLLKKMEALTGMPPIELIKKMRLETAAKLIENRFGNISEIALEVGFNNPSYFSDCFKKQFGCLPSHYHRTSFTS